MPPQRLFEQDGARRWRCGRDRGAARPQRQLRAADRGEGADPARRVRRSDHQPLRPGALGSRDPSSPAGALRGRGLRRSDQPGHRRRARGGSGMAEPAARPRKFGSFHRRFRFQPAHGFGGNRQGAPPSPEPTQSSISGTRCASRVQNAIRSSLQGSRDAISFWLFALQQRLRESATCRGLSRTMRSSAIARARG
jgi:hypothetical protein